MKRLHYAIWNQIDLIYIGLFFLSFFNSTLAIVFMLSLLMYFSRGPEGCVKALLLLTTRGIMSRAVAVPLNTTIKWVVLLGTSLWLILGYKIEYEDKEKVNNVSVALFVFILTIAFGALFESSYPLTALFKMVSFSLPFLAILKGVSMTRKYYRWEDYIASLYLLLFLISVVLIPFARFRITNSNFQGVFNHVNILGIISAVFISFFLKSSIFKDRTIIRTLVVVVVLMMCYLSASRTGMFSCLAVLCVYFICSRGTSGSKFKILVIVGILMTSIWFTMGGEFQQLVTNFIWKSSTNTIFDSRQSIIDAAKMRYESHKLMGTGFMVPYFEGVVDWSLSFSLMVEPGNLFWMLVSDTGILGTGMFVILSLVILRNGSWNRLYLLVGAYIINMGEMVFFSSNNMSILVYMLIALYLFENDSEVEYV